MKDRIFDMTAVMSSDGSHYRHFGIHEVTASVYGDKVEDICNIKMKISSNQQKPKSNTGDMTPDYWGWFEEKDNYFSLVYPQRFLLNMCFPAGIDKTEESGEGKAYRLELVE